MIRFTGKTRHRLTALIVCLSLVTGCSLETTRTGEGTSAPKGTTAGDVNTKPQKPGKTDPGSLPGTTGTLPEESFPPGAVVARRTLGTINSLNPHATTLSSEEEMARYLFGALYLAAGNPQTGALEFVPYHALALPETADGLNYTVKLRPGLAWSDGTPIRAGDYAAAMKLLLDPKLKNPAAGRFALELGLHGAQAYLEGSLTDFSQVGFRALDDQTLSFSLSWVMEPREVYGILTTPFLVPAARYEAGRTADGTMTSFGSDYKALVFSGPYELEEYQAGAYVRLKRRTGTVLDSQNAVYYTGDYITQRQITDKTTALEEFFAGRLDAVSISGRAYRELENDPRVQVVGSNTVWGLYVNTDSPGAELLKNEDFRKALYYGVDRTAIAVTLFGSYNSYSGFVGPQTEVTQGKAAVAYRKTARGKASVPAANVFNLKTAQKLAKTALAGLTAPQTIELTVPAEDVQMLEMAEFLKKSWEELFGPDKVTFTIRTLPLAKMYEAYRNRDYDLGFGGMGQALFDPWRSLAVYTSTYPGKLDTLADPRFDELVQSSIRGPLPADPKVRLDALKEMEDILLARLPQIPLFVNSNAYLVSDRVSLPFKEPVPGLGLGLDMATYKE